MSAARGDTKPCTVPECTGTMKYGRRLDQDADRSPVSRRAEPVSRADETKGWVCSAVLEHFRAE
jgi:hypothetical protein